MEAHVVRFTDNIGNHFNPLEPGRSGCNIKNTIFNLVLPAGIFRSSHDNACRWMPQAPTDDKSTLVKVMDWCHQAKSHYLTQCWPSSMWPYSITSLPRVKGGSLGTPVDRYYPWQHAAHWVPNKMDAILLATFSKAFSRTQNYVFWFKFHVNLTINHHWFRQCRGIKLSLSYYLNQQE